MNIKALQSLADGPTNLWIGVERANDNTSSDSDCSDHDGDDTNWNVYGPTFVTSSFYGW